MANIKTRFLALPEASSIILQTGPGPVGVASLPRRAQSMHESRTCLYGTHHTVEFYSAHYPRHLIELLRRHGQKVVCGLKQRRVTKIGRKEKEKSTSTL